MSNDSHKWPPPLLVLLAPTFVASAGAGQWYAEREARKAEDARLTGRLQISMPADPEDLATTLELLSSLVRTVEAAKKEGAR